MAPDSQKQRLTVSRAFSICSLWPRKFLNISAPYVSVSNAIRVESPSRLLPSSRVSVPAKSLVRSLPSPYGSSDVPAPPRTFAPPRRSVRATCACDSLDIFRCRVNSVLICLSLVVYWPRIEVGIPCISISSCETYPIASQQDVTEEDQQTTYNIVCFIQLDFHLSQCCLPLL